MKGELIRLGDTTVRFLVEAADSGGSVAVFEVGISARGKMPARHSHDSFEETIYGLEGVSTWTVEDAAVEVAPGQALCIPRGAVHHFDNRGDLDAKALAIVTPGVLGPDYLCEVAAVFADSGGGPPDLARIGEVMRRHGLTPAPRPQPDANQSRCFRRESGARSSPSSAAPPPDASVQPAARTSHPPT